MQAEAIFPKTYILPKDNALFLKEETSHKEYIAKTLYSGGRVGVFLYEPSMKKNLHDFAVIQEYIGNPLLINGFKFDTRLFMVVDCKKGVFLYKPGYNVYTAKRFQYKSKDRDRKINQAYAGDDHYDIHNLPRTTSELFMYHVPYDQIIYDVAMKLRKIILATPTDICPMKTSIYGVDMEILDDFDSKIIEINSKPSTRFKKTPWKNELTRALRDEMGSYDSMQLDSNCRTLLTDKVRWSKTIMHQFPIQIQNGSLFGMFCIHLPIFPFVLDYVNAISYRLFLEITYRRDNLSQNLLRR